MERSVKRKSTLGQKGSGTVREATSVLRETLFS